VLKIKRHKTFVKDLKKLQLSDQHFSRYILFIARLIEGVPLPKEALNHPLKGNYEGFFEFHISGDVLVIYKIVDGELWLIRIGTHAQLFKE